ncbi:MAG TPA: TetR/AcrR family transcriptional regulator [Mycobacteriales bacterium]
MSLPSSAPDGPAGRARLPRPARRRQLLDAARDTFVAQGYHAAAMDDIAVRAGVSKPVLYQHFPSKQELYLALLDSAADDLVSAVRTALESTIDNRVRVQQTVRAYLDFVNGNGVHRLVFESDLRADPQVADRVDRMMREAIGLIASTIGGDTGLPDADARLLSVGLAGMAEVAARWWLATRDETNISLEHAADVLSQLVWRGVSGHPLKADD